MKSSITSDIFNEKGILNFKRGVTLSLPPSPNIKKNINNNEKQNENTDARGRRPGRAARAAAAGRPEHLAHPGQQRRAGSGGRLHYLPTENNATGDTRLKKRATRPRRCARGFLHGGRS